MEILDVIKGRYSVRKYRDEAVSDDELNEILEAARFSQSAKNLQGWRFIVVRNQEKRARLVEAAKGQRFVGQAPVVIACLGVGTEYIMTCGQPAYTIDVAIAMENMALTAHNIGLGTCWLGAFYEDQVKTILEIPESEDVRVVGMLTLGKAESSSPAKNRKPLDEIVSYERW